MTSQTAVLEDAGPHLLLSEARPQAKSRLIYLDNLRMALITLVVLGHLAVTYGADFSWYYYEGGEVSPVAYLIVTMMAAIGIGFSMGLFFMLAGYFTPPAYDRKGTKRFLLDRFKRLGIPWLIFEVVINPLVHFAVDVHGGDCKGAFYDCQFQGTFWQYMMEYPRNIHSIGDGPVWFLEALIVFSIFYALWRMVTKPVRLPAPDVASLPHAVPGNGVIALFALAVGLITFVVRFKFTALVFYEPFHFELAHFPQYIALFIVGVYAYPRDWLITFSDRQAKIWRWVALVCILTLPVLAVAVGALSGSLDERAGGGVNWLSFSYSLWEGFLCVSMVISIVMWFRRRFDHQGRLARAMSESAFTVYVLQPAIIVPLALVLSGIRMNLSLKFLLVAPIAVTLCYLIAAGIRKLPVVRAVLA